MTSISNLINECAIYINKFIGIADYKHTDKIAISDIGNLYIQPRTIYRYLQRKYKGQNHIRLNDYIKREFLENYIIYLNKILSIDNENKQLEDYLILLNANKNLLGHIYPSFVLLQQKYKQNNIICNTLNITILQITEFEKKIKTLLQ